MVKVILADATNIRSQRNVIAGEAELLKGIEFNSNARLGAPFTMAIDRATDPLPDTIPY